jgi:hypothetical protein
MHEWHENFEPGRKHGVETQGPFRFTSPFTTHLHKPLCRPPTSLPCAPTFAPLSLGGSPTLFLVFTKNIMAIHTCTGRRHRGLSFFLFCCICIGRSLYLVSLQRAWYFYIGLYPPVVKGSILVPAFCTVGSSNTFLKKIMACDDPSLCMLGYCTF